VNSNNRSDQRKHAFIMSKNVSKKIEDYGTVCRKDLALNANQFSSSHISSASNQIRNSTNYDVIRHSEKKVISIPRSKLEDDVCGHILLQIQDITRKRHEKRYEN